MHILRGVISFTILVCYTLICCVSVYVLSLVQLLCPIRHWRKQLRGAKDGMITAWVILNEQMCRLFRWVRIETNLSDTLASRKNWWLIVSNHLSWADIVIVQIVLRKLAPPIKFFTKRELIWVPFVGLGLWLLRFPYVRRGKREPTQSRQQLRQKSRQELHRAASQFHERPISLLLFLEGTRYTPQKHENQRPPFRHLLRPKLGGLAFSLEALTNEVDRLVNITINYGGEVPGFWHLLSGRCPRVYVQIDTIPVTENFTQDLSGEVTKMWKEKDLVLTALRNR